VALQFHASVYNIVTNFRGTGGEGDEGMAGNDFFYRSLFLNSVVRKFKEYEKTSYTVSISGLGMFVSDVNDLLVELRHLGFDVIFIDKEESVCNICVKCCCETKEKFIDFNYQIDSLPLLVEFSNRTGMSISEIIIMKIVAQLICREKILYKVIVLDLDDTLWKGTLSELGITTILNNIISDYNSPYNMFMRFISLLSDELGIYIAICSRNDIEDVLFVINNVEEKYFPLKNKIDCIVADSNDKSIGLKNIAQQLSVLQDSIVFIDDNDIVREEVKAQLPNVFVPVWSNHTELITQLIVSCVFERTELSLNSQKRRRQYFEIKSERIKNKLPMLYIKVREDKKHCESKRLYSKSNQFKMSSYNADSDNDTVSLLFELFRDRDGGNSLGLSSTVTMAIMSDMIVVKNWAISCRYFEIGLEEFVVSYIKQFANGKRVFFTYEKNEFNKKVESFLSAYSYVFVLEKNNEKEYIEMLCEHDFFDNLKNNTNLKVI